jgi:hypothetical protein
VGEDVDFFSFEGVARRDVVEALRVVRDEDGPLDDPELLARLIDGHAGLDLDAKIFGLEAERRALRKQLTDKMDDLRSTAASILHLPQKHREVSALEIAVADILDVSGTTFKRISAAQQYLETVEKIRSTRLRADTTEFAIKPTNDPSVTRLVTAVADYCWHRGIPFTGAPRREQADNAAAYFPKSRAARLTVSVLEALLIEFRPPELATHMKKARQIIKGLRGGAGTTATFR